MNEEPQWDVTGSQASDQKGSEGGKSMSHRNGAVGDSGGEGNPSEDAECFGGLRESAGTIARAVDRADELEAKQRVLLERLGAMSKAGSALKNEVAGGTEPQSNRERTAMSQELEAEYIRTVVLLARTMHARDGYPDDHGEHLGTLATKLGQRLGLSAKEVEDIRWAARLHNIGKVGIPDAVLGKPGPLTDEEWALIKDHPAIGEEIVLPAESMREVANIIRHHQERWDGTGYPDRLRKETIPLGARILAVAVAYYAMMSARPYQNKMTADEAGSVLNRQAGTQFDPDVVEAFTHIEVRDPRTGAWTDLDEAVKDRLQATLVAT